MHKNVFYKDLRFDIRNLDDIKNCLVEIKPDFIFHLAAQPIVIKSYEDPKETFETNTMGSLNILEALKLLNNKCVGVFITSDKCYENLEWQYGYRENDILGGKDPYSASKAATEIIINCYYNSFFKNSKNVRLGRARAGNVIGGGDWTQSRIIPDCIKAWSKNKIVNLRNPNSTRPWQHVLEPLSGYLKLARDLYFNKNFNGRLLILDHNFQMIFP